MDNVIWRDSVAQRLVVVVVLPEAVLFINWPPIAWAAESESVTKSDEITGIRYNELAELSASEKVRNKLGTKELVIYFLAAAAAAKSVRAG